MEYISKKNLEGFIARNENLTDSELVNKLLEYLKDEMFYEVEAEWKICSDGYYPYCSLCKHEPPNSIMTDFCPCCGADMRKSVSAFKEKIERWKNG